MLNSISLLGVEILVYRDDLKHAVVSGNKLHKLAPNIEIAQSRNCSAILSFGGPYSNHLHALAWASKESGLASIGVIRGELHENLTPTLRDCRNWGMRLIPCQRKDYRDYQEMLSGFTEPCLAKEVQIDCFGIDANATLVIPEGGSNMLAIDSITKAYTQVLRSEKCTNITHAICATGTGATLAGLYQASPEQVQVIGVQAVAEQGATLRRIQEWLGEKTPRLKLEEGHLGGFGKIPKELAEFIDDFEARHHIPLDPIYNGKALFKISNMIAAGKFKKTDRILYINTGGLQGKRIS